IKEFNISPETVVEEGEECEKRCVKVDGRKYWVRSDVRGAIPSLLDQFLSMRRRIKEMLAREYDPRLDAQQKAVKVVANAMYGYMGWTGASYYNKSAAELIAALARDFIKRVRAIIEKMGGDVIYIDTDGIQFTGLDGDKVVDKVNSELPLVIEMEYVAKKAIYWAKKKYVHYVDDKIEVKGLEYIRKDYPPFIRRAQLEYIREYLHHGINGAKKIEEKWRERVMRREIELDDLVIMEQLTKKPDEYEKATKASVAAKMLLEKFGVDLPRGTTLSLVIVKGHGGPTYRAMPSHMVKIEDVDWSYYVQMFNDVMERTKSPISKPVIKRWF
ncbi:MAG: hypothetical protein DRN20_04670, partial [Thermoplasmata archaeon]